MKLRTVSIVLAISTAAAACGSDSQDAAPPTTTITTTTTIASTTTTRPQSTGDGNVRMLSPATLDTSGTVIVDIANVCTPTGLGVRMSLRGGPDRPTREQTFASGFTVRIGFVPAEGAGIVELPLPTGTPPGTYTLNVSCADTDTAGPVWETDITITGQRITPTGQPDTYRTSGRTIGLTPAALSDDPTRDGGSVAAIWAGEQRWLISMRFRAGDDYGQTIDAEIIVPDYFPSGEYDLYLSPTPADPIRIEID